MHRNNHSDWLTNHEAEIKAQREILEKSAKVRSNKYQKLNPSVKEMTNTVYDSGARIRVILSDNNLIDEGLKRLESLMQEELKHRQLSGQDQNKLLRTVIDRELQKLGFSPLGKATDFLAPEVFLSALEKNVIVKDPGAGIPHGEFTHAIQILLVAWANEKHNIFDQPLSNIINKIFKNNTEIDSFQQTQQEWWDNVFDIIESDLQYEPQTPVYSCPDVLHKHIKDNQKNEWQLLSEVIQQREEKRTYDKDKAPAYYQVGSDKEKAWFEKRDEVRARQVKDKKHFPKNTYEPSEHGQNLLLPKKKS